MAHSCDDNSKELDEKIAVVTGGSQGIGFAIALGLARIGADILLVSRQEDRLRTSADEISRATGSRVEYVAADLRTAAGCAKVASKLEVFDNRIDILVNSAGATKGGSFFDLKDEDWEDGFLLKFHGTVRLTRMLWTALAANNGNVVNIAGSAARTPTPDFMIGGAVNAALAHFSKALAELGLPDGVNVNVIHPGQTVTARLEGLFDAKAQEQGISPAKVREEAIRRSGIRRLATVEDMANLAVFLCLPTSRHINGTAIAVDGGATRGLF